MEEMKKLIGLDDEVMIIVGKDDRVFAFKGYKRVEKDGTLLEHVSLDVKLLRSLLPKVVAHTHNMNDKDIHYKGLDKLKPGTKDYEYQLFIESSPSLADLTSEIGIEKEPIEYIFSRFGRTTFQAISNFGADPEDPLALSITQRQLLHNLKGLTRKITEKGITGGKDRLNFMGESLGRDYGCGFKFELYEDLGEKLYEPDREVSS